MEDEIINEFFNGIKGTQLNNIGKDLFNLIETKQLIISGVVQQIKNDFKTLFISTGSRCVPNKNYSSKLDIFQLQDGHAEMLSTKLLKQYLYFKLIDYFNNSENSIFEKFENKLKLKEDVRFHLVISEFPCGFLSIFKLPKSVVQNKCYQDEFNQTGSKKYQDVIELILNPKINRKSKISDIENIFDNDINIVRTKPMRSDTLLENVSLSFSCSDNLLFFSELGIQGLFLSNIIEKIFFSNIIINYYCENEESKIIKEEIQSRIPTNIIIVNFKQFMNEFDENNLKDKTHNFLKNSMLINNMHLNYRYIRESKIVNFEDNNSQFIDECCNILNKFYSKCSEEIDMTSGFKLGFNIKKSNEYSLNSFEKVSSYLCDYYFLVLKLIILKESKLKIEFYNYNSLNTIHNSINKNFDLKLKENDDNYYLKNDKNEDSKHRKFTFLLQFIETLINEIGKEFETIDKNIKIDDNSIKKINYILMKIYQIKEFKIKRKIENIENNENSKNNENNKDYNINKDNLKTNEINYHNYQIPKINFISSYNSLLLDKKVYKSINELLYVLNYIYLL